MKHLLPTLLAALLCSNLFAQNLQLGWGYTNGSTGTDGANDLVVDAAGNSYVTGYFSGTVDFDKGPGTANLSVPAGQTAKDAFVLKLDAQGNYVWAIRIGGTNNADQEGSKIALDTAGNVVVSGIFNGNLSLPPSATNYNAPLTEVGSFMLKLDTAGTVLWGRAWAHASNEIRIEDFVIDSLNFIVAVGEFTGTVNFSTTATPNFKTSAGGKDFFVFKSGSAGHVQLAETGGNANNDFATSVVSVANNYIIQGGFSGALDFDNSSAVFSLSSIGNTYDCYLLKLNAGLTFLNAYSFGGNQGTIARGLSFDGQSIYSIGQSTGTSDLDPNPNSVSAYVSNSQRPFIQKLDLLLNLIWVRVIESTSPTTPFGIATNSQGRPTVIGRFSGTLDVNPDPTQTYNLVSPVGTAGFVVSLDSSGTFLNAFSLSTSLTNFPYLPLLGVAYSTQDALLVVGSFASSLDIDPSASTATATSAGLEDMLVLKLISCNSSTVNTSATACGSYTLSNGQVITQSGTYTDTLQTIVGCDSILNINLTINPLPSTTLVWQGTALHVQNTSTANTYQWLDCTSGQAIAGATDSTFTPTSNGSFAVVVSNGTCTDTSICETLTNFSIEESASFSILVYPNPTTGLLNLQSQQPLQKVEVLDLTGRLVFSKTKPSEEINLGTLPIGVYMVKVYNEQGIVVQRILKI